MSAAQRIKKYGQYLIYAAGARLRSEVSNSYLNWIWWILEPMLDMAVYIVIFGYFFNMSEEHFPLFLYIGISIWSFFSKSVRGSVGLIKRNRDIITRIYIPKSVLLLKEILVNLFKLMLSFLIIALMMLLDGVRLTPAALGWFPFMLELLLITYGVSAFFLHMGVFYEDLEYVVSVLLNILMYFSGIFFSIERFLPGWGGRALGSLNPLAFLITSMRNSIIYGRWIEPGPFALWLLISLTLSVAGTYLIRISENSYVKVR